MPASQNRKKKRKVNHLPEVKKICIFCEGVKTEPLYFTGFKEAIETIPIYNNMIKVEVEGVGAETVRVLEAAEEYVKDNDVRNAEIWCVYDKDSFPPQDFNNVPIFMSQLNESEECRRKAVEYFAAWSNQCVEYWFILHFAFYDSDNDRDYYRSFLHQKFQTLGFDGYEKNNKELFSIMTNCGNPAKAIEFAKRRIQECDGLPPAKSVPATKIHLLVLKLAEYLPQELRNKYIPTHE